jgi:hypothetical protein
MSVRVNHDDPTVRALASTINSEFGTDPSHMLIAQLIADRFEVYPPAGGDELADWLGAMPEAHNVFDHTDEATTMLTIDVETLAARLAQRILEAKAEGAALGRRAVNDPGAFVKRGPDYDGEPYGERLDQWQGRAIEVAITQGVKG